MEWFFLGIPLILSGIFLGVVYLLKGELPGFNESGFWFLSGICPTLISLMLIPALSFGLKERGCSDTEYVSYYITKIRHYDEWDEWIHKTCTRKVQKGTDDKGNPIWEEEEYDCSYREFHPERWTKFNNAGSEIHIGREEFNRIKSSWGTQERFIDMHRHYYRIDGDAQEYDWCGEWFHCETSTYSRSYRNVIKGSGSVFNNRKVSEEEARELGLYEYPEPSRWDDNDPSPLLGLDPSGRHIKKFQYLNAYYGAARQIHIFVLAWPADTIGPQIVEDQKAYWGGGNKNEFVICLGIDRERIAWADCFSWQDQAELDVKCRDYLISMKVLNLDRLGDWLEQNLGLWKRKEFKDFDYIEPVLSEGDLSIIMWTVILTSIAILIGAGFVLREI